jgi:hypothetical protein
VFSRISTLIALLQLAPQADLLPGSARLPGFPSVGALAFARLLRRRIVAPTGLGADGDR